MSEVSDEQTAPPMEETPFRTVAVDVDAEVRKLAKRQHVDPRLLNQGVEVTRYQYLRATVISYYQGRDDGYLDMLQTEYKLRYRSYLILIMSMVMLLSSVALFLISWWRAV